MGLVSLSFALSSKFLPFRWGLYLAALAEWAPFGEVSGFDTSSVDLPFQNTKSCLMATGCASCFVVFRPEFGSARVLRHVPSTSSTVSEHEECVFRLKDPKPNANLLEVFVWKHRHHKTCTRRASQHLFSFQGRYIYLYRWGALAIGLERPFCLQPRLVLSGSLPNFLWVSHFLCRFSGLDHVSGKSNSRSELLI